MSEERFQSRIVMRARESLLEHALMNLMIPGLGLLTALLDNEKIFEVEAIDKRSGARATGFGRSEREAEFEAVDQLISMREFREG